MGEIDTKVIVLGNFLYQDSVLFRLGEMIKEGKMKGVFLRIPLVDENNKIAWPGKFPSLEAVEELRQSIGNEITWQRDFLLRAIPDDYQIIHPEYIHYYDELPSQEKEVMDISIRGRLLIRLFLKKAARTLQPWFRPRYTAVKKT